jgi:cytochrome c biogenesis protein CcdA/thiol-disulfide isomerase/thioredoxin
VIDAVNGRSQQETAVTIYILAFVAGVLTIASPCIFPILPVVMARATNSFRRDRLPLLAGLALGFAVTASLASVAGAWAIETNRYGRAVALVAVTLFGLALILPGLASRLATPAVFLGTKLADALGKRERERTPALSILLGVATGLIWAPCAGPILGLILSGAAFYGPRIETFLLLLVYGLGAATSLAVGMFLGRRFVMVVRSLLPWSEGARRVLGATVVAGAIAVWTGLDTRVLVQLSFPMTTALERNLVSALQPTRPVTGAETVESIAARAELPEPLASVLDARQWLNSSPLTAKELKGKVVLVSFWTYSCINCLRALPHVRAWAEKYRDQGLVVIGIHTPEFAFEKSVENVSAALGKLGVRYPVAIDNDFRIWRAFNNNAWPALYFVDAEGRIRHRYFGEGDYALSEDTIKTLLKEAGRKSSIDLATVDAKGVQVEADIGNLKSPETYLGYAQTRGFASPGGVREDISNVYRSIKMLPLNRWTLGGIWTIGREFAQLNETSGRITYRFHARDLHLVMVPAANGTPIRFRVTVDGQSPGESRGVDVDAQGYGVVSEAKLYQLVRQSDNVTDRTFEIEFLDAGVRVYAFTFG